MKHEFSLASKLATLDIGQSIWLEDGAPMMNVTNMERQITNLIVKSKKLQGRKFATTRGDAITVGHEHYRVLRVLRLA